MGGISTETRIGYSKSQDLNPKFPRDVIKEAFHYDTLDSESLVRHIDEGGFVFFTR